MGAALLVGLLGVVIWRIWRTAQLAPDTTGTLLCVGILSMFLFHVFENIGMTLGIMPVTGIPLPFVSYGGSSHAHVVPGAIGLVQSVHMHRFSCRAGGSVPVRRPRYSSIHHVRPSGRSHEVLDLWDRLEPLLPRVQRPARYIGCEDGAPTPDWSARRPGRPRGLAADLPRHLRDRPAQPGPADPLRDPQRAPRRSGRAVLRPVGGPGGGDAGRRACRCSAWTPTGRPATSTCWRSTCPPS